MHDLIPAVSQLGIQIVQEKDGAAVRYRVLVGRVRIVDPVWAIRGVEPCGCGGIPIELYRIEGRC